MQSRSVIIILTIVGVSLLGLGFYGLRQSLSASPAAPTTLASVPTVQAIDASARRPTRTGIPITPGQQVRTVGPTDVPLSAAEAASATAQTWRDSYQATVNANPPTPWFTPGSTTTPLPALTAEAKRTEYARTVANVQTSIIALQTTTPTPWSECQLVVADLGQERTVEIILTEPRTLWYSAPAAVITGPVIMNDFSFLNMHYPAGQYGLPPYNMGMEMLRELAKISDQASDGTFPIGTYRIGWPSEYSVIATIYLCPGLK